MTVLVPAVPLVVDVDGTLLCTDLLLEAALQFIARFPLETPRLLWWLLSGRVHLKTQLAARLVPPITTMPLRAETVALMDDARQAGQPVYLASASDQRYVDILAERLGGISGAFGTSSDRNLAGEAKADVLCAIFGEQGFDYVGDRPVDLAVWRRARRRFLVAHDRTLATRVRREVGEVQVIADARVRGSAYYRSVRAHQWSKNGLIFLGGIAGHDFGAEAIGAMVIAFVCFSAAASSAYLINDLLDLPGDRVHHRKRNRPLAAGTLPIFHGIVLALLLMVGAALLALLLPLAFSLALGCYVVVTLSYSFYLKRKALVDVITLASLYTIRVYAGLAAISGSGSQWLLMFSLCLFLCLAIEKRCSELVRRRDEPDARLEGRNYRVTDLAILFPMAAASGYGAVLVVTLYLSSQEVLRLYTHPGRLWLICVLLLYWISRVLLLSNRNEMHDDPVVFALTDRISWYVAACVAVVIGMAI